MRPDPNDPFQSYRFEDWHEDIGDVLWWLLPVSEAPYVGSPRDLGRGVFVTLQIGVEMVAEGASLGNTGGWPFEEADEPNLVWTILPGAIRMPR